MGQTIENTGGMMQELAYKHRVEADAAMVQGRLALTNKAVFGLLSDPKTGLLNKKGEDALGMTAGLVLKEGEVSDVVSEGADRFKGISESAMEGLTPAQQKLLRPHLTQLEKETSLSLMRHEAREGQAVKAKNAESLVDSEKQLLGTYYTDIVNDEKGVPMMGPQFDSHLKKGQAAVIDAFAIQGYHNSAPGSPVYNGVMKFKSDVYTTAFEQIAKTGNPMMAQQLLNRYAGEMEPGQVMRLQGELQPKIEAYAVEGLITTAEGKAKQNPEDPYDIEKVYEAVKAETKDPHMRKLAYAELEHNKHMHDQGTAERYDAAAGHILKQAHESWDKFQEANINNIKKSEPFGKLTEMQQSKLLGILEAENWKIHSHNETMTGERRKLAHEANRDVKAAQEKTANFYYGNQDLLASMTKEQFNALNVTHSDFKQLSALKQKLTKPENLHSASAASGIVNRTIDKIPGLTTEQQLKYHRAVQNSINAESDRLKRALSPQETEEATVKAMQTVAVEEPTPWYVPGKTRKVEKRRVEVKAGEQTKSAPMTSMPPAAQHKGRTITDTDTKKRYKSDGKSWVEI
jgi:hypothetical protein